MPRLPQPWRRREQREERDRRAAQQDEQTKQLNPLTGTHEMAVEHGREGGVKSGEARRAKRDRLQREARLARIEAELAELAELPEPTTDVSIRVLLDIATNPEATDSNRSVAAMRLANVLQAVGGGTTQQERWTAGEELIEAGYPDAEMVDLDDAPD